MKKLFTLVVLCALAFSACENGGDNNADTPAPGNTNLKLELTSPANGILEFPAEGGTGEITFTLSEVEEDTRSAAPTNVSAKTNAEWISDITVSEGKVTFTVAANDGAERSDIVYIKYGLQSKLVSVMQTGLILPDVVFNATHLGGSYFGRFITEKGLTDFNYYVILGDMRADHYQSKQDQATEYRFDIYSNTSSAFNTIHGIPVGTYKLDHSSSGRGGTIDGDQDSSYFLPVNYEREAYADATLVVTEDSIVADIRFYNGKVHHIEYHGSLIFEDYIQNTYADVYPVSQYTKDITFNVNNGYINARFRGDYYGTGCDVWFLDMIEEKSPYNGVYLILDLLIPKSGGFENLDAIVGDYTIFDQHPDSYEYTIPMGRLRDDSLQMHAWYLNCVNSQVDMSKAAPITSGTISVTKSGNAYVFEVNGTDDNGNKIIGTFSGYIADYMDQTK
ncbi:MAG: BACON domain-containing protein [Alistipes sp.]|nr:BACON domain-containing protein [Alistipes sp.]